MTEQRKFSQIIIYQRSKCNFMILQYNMRIITKYVNHQKATSINPYSGYSYHYGLQREILCMKLLYNSYKKYPCKCGLNTCHFPILIKSKMYNNKNNLGGYIKMTYEGEDIQSIRRKKKIPRIKNVEAQIDCILNTLKFLNIVHLDLNDNGKNICIDSNGKISLIDFDIMYFKSLDSVNTLTPLMYRRISRFKEVDFKNKLLKIVTSMY